MKEAKPDYAQGEAAVAARAIADSGGWEPFVDWSSTCSGNRGVNREGRYELYDAPIGIAITIEEADKSTPLVVAETPWEHGGSLVPL